MNKVIVVGGGAAGMMASIIAARNNNKVYLYEKNDKLGKKLYITGKGRCNITNASDVEILISNVLTNPKFLYSAFYSFTNDMMVDFLNDIGLRTKVERGERVFPVSDKSSDVIKVLEKEMKKLGVIIKYNQEVRKINSYNNIFHSITLSDNTKVEGDKVIIATGGLSYASTGSTGDGYRFAKKMGHTIVDTKPSLVPMNIKEQWVKDLQGLSLKNVNVKILKTNKVLFENFGEMIFTHFGVSGPLILSASAYLVDEVYKDLKVVIDLKPALSFQKLDQRIIRDFEKRINKSLKNSLDDLLPKKLIPIIIDISNINPYKKVNEITREERHRLVDLIKGLECSIDSLRGYNEAIITRGGISVTEIDSYTMESKKIKGVHFIGEVLDLDALTGGYNLQIAWSTAYLAGINV